MSDVQRQGRSALEVQLLDELSAMSTYALGTGARMPDSVVSVVMQVQGVGDAPLDSATLVAVENAHESLSRALAPATPQALNLFDNEAHRVRRFSWLPSLGPVALVRQLTLVGVLFLIGFILLGLSSSVSRTSGGILDSSGTTLLVNLLFVLCASGLGAVFAALFRINQYIARRTYDPIYESSYWVNIVLGLIGGLLLAELLLEIFDSGVDGDPSETPFARPLLALVGGFSAEVVFQILNRLVEAVGSVFKGDASELVAANTEAARAKLILQQTEDRVKLSTKLVQLQQSLNTGATPEQLAAKVDEMLDELLPYNSAGPVPPPLPASNGVDKPPVTVEPPPGPPDQADNAAVTTDPAVPADVDSSVDSSARLSSPVDGTADPTAG